MLNYKIRVSNIILKNRKLYLVKLNLQYIRISIRMIAQYSNRKLETVLLVQEPTTEVFTPFLTKGLTT